jgi:hypothetical protein
MGHKARMESQWEGFGQTTEAPWLPLIGPAFLALSTVFPWTTDAAAVDSGPVYATEVGVPFVSDFFMNRAPTVAQVVIVLAIVASGLILVQARWADILRRVLGACAVIVEGLPALGIGWFAVGFGEVTIVGLLSFFGLGLYLAVIGGILLIGLPSARRRHKAR